MLSATATVLLLATFLVKFDLPVAMVFWGICFPKYADAAAVAAAVAIVVKAPLSVKFICPWYGDACSAAWAAAAATSAIVSVGDNGPLACLLPSEGIGVVSGTAFLL